MYLETPFPEGTGYLVYQSVECQNLRASKLEDAAPGPVHLQRPYKRGDDILYKYRLHQVSAVAGHHDHRGRPHPDGEAGGGGLRLKYSNPIYLDDVAADFPDMPIIMAHPSVPWQDEALSVATHKPNVYIDLSGWSPKYFEPKLVQYANTLLKHKVLFGTDNPAISPDRWLSDFEKIDIRPEVRPLIMKENAAQLLGLTDPKQAQAR